MVVTVDWGSGGGPKVSTKFHNPLVIDGMDKNVPTEDTGSIGAKGTKSGSNIFMSVGLNGGSNPPVKKSPGKFESSIA